MASQESALPSKRISHLRSYEIWLVGQRHWSSIGTALTIPPKQKVLISLLPFIFSRLGPQCVGSIRLFLFVLHLFLSCWLETFLSFVFTMKNQKKNQTIFD